MMRDRWRRRILFGQAAYYVATGLWPLLHLSSFEAVTGPKVDDWLVRMVGCLVLVIGVTLGSAVSHRRHYASEIVVLAVGSAAAFAAIDIWYAAIGRISLIYLADAAVEIGLAAGMGLTRALTTLPEPPD